MPSSRITEGDLVVPALRLMSQRPGGFISTTDLIAELEDIFQPQGRDADILADRSDTYFSQKVRNLISHRTTPSSFVARGFAVYEDDRRGLRITDRGRDLLRQIEG